MFLLLKIKLHFSESVNTFTKESHNQTEYTNEIVSLHFRELSSVSYQGCLIYIIKQN